MRDLQFVGCESERDAKGYRQHQVLDYTGDHIGYINNAGRPVLSEFLVRSEYEFNLQEIEQIAAFMREAK
jgi:hypothetical protein